MASLATLEIEGRHRGISSQTVEESGTWRRPATGTDANGGNREPPLQRSTGSKIHRLRIPVSDRGPRS
jgi:hypothetical protein